MTKAQLETSIKTLAELRDSNEIIFYLTSDKKPPELFATAIATDTLAIFEKHLSKIGQENKISLFLNTTGGSLEAPWPIVSLIREYCKELAVIVPFQALSAGTLICLGADKIVMTPSSFLSPIDPRGSYRLGAETKSIQIEDVVGFIDFAKNKVGLSEQGSLAEVMKLLSSEIPPSILGSVNRTHSLIRMLAGKMLKLHKTKLDDNQIRQIVENLTEKLYSHQYLIGRKEAKTVVGFHGIIHNATSDEEKLIKQLMKYFSDEMELSKKFDPAEYLQGDAVENTIRVSRAIIKSSAGQDTYTTDYRIQKIQDPAAPKPFNVSWSDKEWIEK